MLGVKAYFQNVFVLPKNISNRLADLRWVRYEELGLGGKRMQKYSMNMNELGI
jgi:hypothetical protein